MRNWEKVNNYFCNKINKSLIDIAIGLKYSDFNIAILKDDIENAKIYDPIQWNILSSNDYCNDKRSIEEFGKDIIAGWILEDYVQNKLRNLGLRVFKNGTDKYRTFSAKPTCKSDFRFRYKGYIYDLEMITDYGNYWERSDEIYLRDKKWDRLRDNDSLLLCVNLTQDKFFILDPNYDTELITKQIKAYDKYGGKPATLILVTTGVSKYESSFTDKNSVNDQLSRIFNE